MAPRSVITVSFIPTGGTSTGDMSTVTDQNDGTYTATFTGQTANLLSGLASVGFTRCTAATLGFPLLGQTSVLVRIPRSPDEAPVPLVVVFGGSLT